MEITEVGIVIYFNEEQRLKANCPIDTIEEGIFICFSDEQP